MSKKRREKHANRIDIFYAAAVGSAHANFPTKADGDEETNR